MKIVISLQNATHSNIPTLAQLNHWVETIFKIMPTTSNRHNNSLTIRFIDKEESATLNETFRQKKGPTNILSFADEPIPGFTSDSLGDLAICAPLVIEEAKIQVKQLLAHYAHLVIHGVLHLLGYDHTEEQDANKMENLEIKILAALGYQNPYE